MSSILITGSGSGLGAALHNALVAWGHDVYEFDIKNGNDVRLPTTSDFWRIHRTSYFDILINCAGVNKINWLDDVTEEEWDEVMEVNVKGIFKMSQMMAPVLRESKGTILNIVSNAAHMPMRCSAAYNASKGAALILTKQLARELSPYITVFSVSPNKLAGTGMSKSIDEQVMKTRGWSLEEAQKYQLQGLLTGEETPVKCVAEFIAYLLQDKEHHKYLTGCDIPYGA